MKCQLSIDRLWIEYRSRVLIEGTDQESTSDAFSTLDPIVQILDNCPYPQDPCEVHCQQSSSSMIRLISNLSTLHDVYLSVHNI